MEVEDYTMSLRRFFRKINVMIMAITLITLLSGTAIYASGIVNTTKEHKVDLHTSVVVNISEQMVLSDLNNKLGENPEYNGTLQVQVKGVPEEFIHNYKLCTIIKLYEDKDFKREIKQGFKVQVSDETKELNSKHDIRIILTIEDPALGGNQVYIKAFSSLEKI